MSKPPAQQVLLRVRYDGAGPVHWSGGDGDFGLQDKDNGLLQGRADAEGRICFDFALEVRFGDHGAPLFQGHFAHGKPGDRFLYLSWRNREGNYAQRFKLPLGGVTALQVDQALTTAAVLLADLVVGEQRATTTGANVGGTRVVAWSLSPA